MEHWPSFKNRSIAMPSFILGSILREGLGKSYLSGEEEGKGSILPSEAFILVQLPDNLAGLSRGNFS